MFNAIGIVIEGSFGVWKCLTVKLGCHPLPEESASAKPELACMVKDSKMAFSLHGFFVFDAYLLINR